MKKLLIALVLALSSSIAFTPAADAGLFGRSEPKGGHSKGARQSTSNKHQAADGRRAREQAAAAQRQSKAKSASARKQQVAKQQKAAGKRRGK